MHEGAAGVQAGVWYLASNTLVLAREIPAHRSHSYLFRVILRTRAYPMSMLLGRRGTCVRQGAIHRVSPASFHEKYGVPPSVNEVAEFIWAVSDPPLCDCANHGGASLSCNTWASGKRTV